MYEVRSAILFLIFNRPDTTARVFEKIRLLKPKRLYISADGPRTDRLGDVEACAQARAVINVDWDCEVRTLYRENNLGCKIAVSSGIKWFFNQEEEGIILEDDCLPNVDFFRFCDVMLSKYRTDTRVRHVSGSRMNYDKTFGQYTYYFSKFTNIWGWASWRRVWENYDENLLLLDQFIEQDLFKNIYTNNKVINNLQDALLKTKNSQINTWDYQYAFLNFWNNGLSICPNYNLISNIGFDQNGTHTMNPNHQYANLPLEAMTDISHPKFFVPLIEADYHMFNLERPTFRKRITKKIKNIVG